MAPLKQKADIPSASLEMLQKSLAALVALNETELLEFSGRLKQKLLKRRTLLLKEGEICSYTAFIVKGCLRYFYVVDGEEHTGQFFFENSWYTDYESFLSGKPSSQNIEALESCELLLLEKHDLEALYTSNPKFERFGRLMAERAYLGVRRRNESLTNLSAEERYLNLMKERPKVFERVPQHYIASYLNIKPQSLSRIRKNIT